MMRKQRRESALLKQGKERSWQDGEQKADKVEMVVMEATAVMVETITHLQPNTLGLSHKLKLELQTRKERLKRSNKSKAT